MTLLTTQILFIKNVITIISEIKYFTLRTYETDNIILCLLQKAHMNKV